jgi:signal transduction histidine kinase
LADTPLSLEQKHYINTIQSSCEALLRIINDILDYSKIEAGKLTLKKPILICINY